MNYRILAFILGLLLLLPTSFLLAQPVLVADVTPGSAGTLVFFQHDFQNAMYFYVYYGDSGNTDVWRHDGTIAENLGYFRRITGIETLVYDNDIYYRSMGNIVRFDGINFGYLTVEEIADRSMFPGEDISSSYPLLVHDGQLLFSVPVAEGSEYIGSQLYTYDGSVARRIPFSPELSDLSTNVDLFHSFTSYRGIAYFRVYPGRFYDGPDPGLLMYDGTSIKPAVSVQPAFYLGESEYSIIYNGSLYYRGNDGTRGSELWKFDGGTPQLIADINPGGAHSKPHYFRVYNDNLYFVANDGIHGEELFRYDGASVELVADINSTPGQGSSLGKGSFASLPGIHHKSFGNQLIEYDGRLYFSADDGEHGQELWTYDGTTASLAADIYPGIAHSGPDYLTVFDGALYFTAINTGSNQELWQYDGSTARLVKEIHSDPRWGNVHSLMGGESGLYMVASDGVHGGEPWVLTSSDLEEEPEEPTVTIIPDHLKHLQGLELGFYAQERDWCWTGPFVDWELPPFCGEEGQPPCPEDLFGVTLQDAYQETVWQQYLEQPGELEFPLEDEQPYSLLFSVGEQSELPFLQLAANLVPAGIADVQMSMLPEEGILSLSVGTDEEVEVPLLLSLANEAGKVVWQTEFTAPFDGEFADELEQSGTTLRLSVAEEEEYNYRTENYTKSISKPQGLSNTVFSNESAIQVYPNPVVNHTLQLEVFSPEASSAKIEILNLVGQQVLQQELSTQAGQQRLTVDMQGVPQGAYILQVQQGQQQTTTRLLVPE